jgi:hypothetical protein
MGISSFLCDFVGQIFAEDETTAVHGPKGWRKFSTILLLIALREGSFSK